MTFRPLNYCLFLLLLPFFYRLCCEFGVWTVTVIWVRIKVNVFKYLWLTNVLSFGLRRVQLVNNLILVFLFGWRLNLIASISEFLDFYCLKIIIFTQRFKKVFQRLVLLLEFCLLDIIFKITLCDWFINIIFWLLCDNLIFFLLFELCQIYPLVFYWF
jgi:hypothetical protein